jgi:hypothetical protein
MTQALLRLPVDRPEREAPRAALPVPTGDRALLEHLRSLARRSQLAAPVALEQTCRLIEPGSADAYGMALMRSLSVLAARPMVFHPRGAEEASFDELWLLRLLRCIQSGDTDSARLLIGRRTDKLGRRTITWLACGFAERLDSEAS